MSEPLPLPLHPTRRTAEAMRQDILDMNSALIDLMQDTPTREQWRAAESLALGMLSAIRKGATATNLIAAADAARAARAQAHEDAMVLQLDRMGMSETATRIHPVFAGLCAPLQGATHA